MSNSAVIPDPAAFYNPSLPPQPLPHQQKVYPTVSFVHVQREQDGSYGSLRLLQLNNHQYVCDFYQPLQLNDPQRLLVDALDLRVDPLNQRIEIDFPPRSGVIQSFRSLHIVQYRYFIDAVEECRAISSLTLHLNSILRDCYYSGVYRHLDPDAKIIVPEEIERLKKDNPQQFFNRLLNTSAVATSSSAAGNSMGHGTRRGNASSHQQQGQQAQNHDFDSRDICCFYCDARRNDGINKDTMFVIHPYVPKTSTNLSVLMCSICIDNWKEYREIAEHSDMLLLEGELNEEICAVCSDSPPNIVMCSSCPRSYCEDCLVRLLTPKEMKLLQSSGEDEDWICMCCKAGINKHPPLSKSAWKAVVDGKKADAVKEKAARRLQREIAMKEKSQRAAEKAAAEATAKKAAEEAEVAAKKVAAQAETAQRKAEAVAKKSALAAARKRNADDVAQMSPEAEQCTGIYTSTLAVDRPDASLSQEVGIADAFAEKDALEALISLHSSGGSRSSKSKKKGTKFKSGSAHSGGVVQTPPLLPQPEPIEDSEQNTEDYYWVKYLNYIMEREEMMLSLSRDGNNSVHFETEETCFLCKDGGDLIECDWQSADNPRKCARGRCLKVYHADCLLSGKVPGPHEKWTCQRHLCDMCCNPTKPLFLICKYCPLSLCESCPETFAMHFRVNKYCEVEDPFMGRWCHTPLAKNAKSIICPMCMRTMDLIPDNKIPEKVKEALLNVNMLTKKRIAEVDGLDTLLLTGDKVKLESIPLQKAKLSNTSSKASKKKTVASTSETPFASPRIDYYQTQPKERGRWSEIEMDTVRQAAAIYGSDVDAVLADTTFKSQLSGRSRTAIETKLMQCEIELKKERALHGEQEVINQGSIVDSTKECGDGRDEAQEGNVDSNPPLTNEDGGVRKKRYRRAAEIAKERMSNGGNLMSIDHNTGVSEADNDAHVASNLDSTPSNEHSTNDQAAKDNLSSKIAEESLCDSSTTILPRRKRKCVQRLDSSSYKLARTTGVWTTAMLDLLREQAVVAHGSNVDKMLADPTFSLKECFPGLSKFKVKRKYLEILKAQGIDCSSSSKQEGKQEATDGCMPLDDGSDSEELQSMQGSDEEDTKNENT